MTPDEAAHGAQVWQDAQLALLVLQLQPHGLGGIWLRAGHGPVRDAWLAGLQSTSLATLKIPAQVDDERLLGGIDLTQTLQSARPVQQAGLLAAADGGVVLLPMAERLLPRTVALIAQAHDTRSVQDLAALEARPARFTMVALDESEADEAGLSARLGDRLDLWLDLRKCALADTAEALEPLDQRERVQALERLHIIVPSEDQVRALCETAMALGIGSLRAPLMALRFACVHAALHGREAMDDEDLAAAARMVLGPRATRMPAPAESSQDDPAPPPPDASEGQEAEAETSHPAHACEPQAPDTETLIAAALAGLTPHFLDRLQPGTAGKPSGQALGTSGQAQRSKLRGRPLSPRRGKPGSGARLHLLATLRAAAPMQRLRPPVPAAGKLRLRAEDFHVQRFAQRSPTCLIFALDASGSAAMQRLAEAKGAVEMLLQASYARRDSVCVIAFRVAHAEVLLPPTRSLVRAKRALAALPGGGGTPLANGIQTALQQAHALHRTGTTPILVMLSDGRANVSAAGIGGRAQARTDALAWAGQWRNYGYTAAWIDTSAQPDAQAQALAHQMGARYIPMPYVQAQPMAAAVQGLAAQGNRP